MFQSASVRNGSVFHTSIDFHIRLEQFYMAESQMCGKWEAVRAYKLDWSQENADQFSKPRGW